MLSVESFGRIFALWIPDNLPNQQSYNLIILHIFTHVRCWNISTSSLHNFFEGHYDLANFTSHRCMQNDDDWHSIRIFYLLFFHTYRTLSNYIKPEQIFNTILMKPFPQNLLYVHNVRIFHDLLSNSTKHHEIFMHILHCYANTMTDISS